MESTPILTLYKRFLTNRRYILPVSAALVFAFAFSFVHIVQGVDDLCRSVYTEDYFYISFSGRTAGYLVMCLLGPEGHETRLQVIWGVLGLALGAVTTCVLFAREDGENRIPLIFYTVFSCLLITAPINVSIWIYADTGFMVKWNYLWIPLALLLLPGSRNDRFFPLRAAGAILLLGFAVSCFEIAAAVTAGLTGAMLLLYAQNARIHGISERNILRGILRRGLCIAFALLIGILLWKQIGSLFVESTGKQATQASHWLDHDASIRTILDMIRRQLIIWYGVGAFFHLSIAVNLISWGIAIILLCICLVRGKYASALPLILLILSPVALLIARGDTIGYRTDQGLALFAAFLPSCLLILFREKRGLFRSTAIVLSLLAVAQCFYTNRLFHMEYEYRQELDERLISSYKEVLNRYGEGTTAVFDILSANNDSPVRRFYTDCSDPIYNFFMAGFLSCMTRFPIRR